MSLSMNRVTLAGHISTEPERRQTRKGRPVVSFRVVVSRRTTVGDDHTSIIDVTAFDTVAESCVSLHQGDVVAVDGWLHQDRWIGRDGTGRQKLVVAARRVMCIRESERVGTIEPSQPEDPHSHCEPTALDHPLAWLRQPCARGEGPVQPSATTV